MNYFNPNKVRQFFFLLLLVITGWVLFQQMRSFIPAFLGALTFYVLMRKWMFTLVERKWKPSLAALFLMFLSFLIFMVPVYVLINMLSSKVAYVINHSTEIEVAVLNYIKKIELKLGYDFVNDESIKKLVELSAGKMPLLIGATFSTLTTIAMMYFILYFMLTQAKELEKGFASFLPVSNKNIRVIRNEVNSMVVSNAVGIPLIALLQGLVAFIGYLVLGVKDPFMWFVVTCFAAMIPVVGAAIVYVPLAIIFFVEGENIRGILMLIVGFGVVGVVDNFFRFWLQKKIGDVHPLITVFGVIIGLQLFGFIGLVFGPLLISLFLLLVKIYNIEYSEEPSNSSNIVDNQSDV